MRVLGPSVGQLPAQRLVEFADIGGTFDHVAAIVLQVHFLMHACHVGGELADNLLEDILQRDQAFHIAVLIDHDAGAPFLLLKVEQLRMQRRRLGDEVGLPSFLHDRGLGDLVLGQEARRVAQVQHADDVVDVAFEDRHPGMLAGADLREDVVQFVFEVDAHHLVARAP